MKLARGRIVGAVATVAVVAAAAAVTAVVVVTVAAAAVAVVVAIATEAIVVVAGTTANHAGNPEGKRKKLKGKSQTARPASVFDFCLFCFARFFPFALTYFSADSSPA